MRWTTITGFDKVTGAAGLTEEAGAVEGIPLASALADGLADRDARWAGITLGNKLPKLQETFAVEADGVEDPGKMAVAALALASDESTDLGDAAGRDLDLAEVKGGDVGHESIADPAGLLRAVSARCAPIQVARAGRGRSTPCDRTVPTRGCS